jgi:hypothetical protein
MNQLILFAIIAVLIFVLTYDPKSGNLEKYMSKYSADPATGCADPKTRSSGTKSCDDSNYDAIQFAKPNSAFELPEPSNSKLGAIIRR